VVLWGAYVRATGSGAGCGSHWPLCNGEFLPLTSRTQTLIEFTHRATSGLSLFLVATLLVWSWRRTAKGEWPRYSAVAAAVLLFNEAILGAMLVVFEHVGMDRSASRAVFLSLHFGNTLLLVAALTLTAKWLSNSTRRFAPSAKALERAVIAIGLFCVVATGMTGTLAALGDAISPSANLRWLKCRAENPSPNEIGLLFPSCRMLSDIEPHLENVADRQTVLFNDSPEYALAVAWNADRKISAVFVRVFRKA
jgi:heme a synthase